MVRVAPINLTFNPRTLWFDPGDLDIEKDMPVVVRTARGTEFGIAASEVIEVSEEQVRALKSALRPVERIATEEDIEQAAEMERASAEALPVFKEMAREYHEDMHPVSVEFLLDGDKAVYATHWLAGGNDVKWDMVHYDVQLFGGVVLHKGKIAEMATGEGKTLVATLPVFLNALARKGVHMVTVNNYLAKRDSEWMGPMLSLIHI